VADLQIEYSLSRGVETQILPTCRDLGVGVTAYGVLSRGLLGGDWSRQRASSPCDIRAHMPRFRPENLERSLGLVEALRSIAVDKGASVAQIAVAWVLSRGKDIVPLMGTTRRDRLAEAIGALELELTDGELAEIERAVPPGAGHPKCKDCSLQARSGASYVDDHVTSSATRLRRRAFLLEYTSMAWMTVEAVVAIAAGLAAHSRRPDRLQLGLGHRAGVVIWELWGADEQRERRATRLIGVMFFLLAAYVAVEAARDVLTDARPVPISLPAVVQRYYDTVMGKEKVTLTLDAGQLEDLRRIAGARSLSAAVDTAVAAYLARLRHLASVDEWLAELEREHGPIPSETLEWAARLVEEWDESRPASGLRAG
jgi:hypothetical protein